VGHPFPAVTFILGSATPHKTSCGSDKRKHISENDRNKSWYKKDETERGIVD
jgi:hypothetical protein